MLAWLNQEELRGKNQEFMTFERRSRQLEEENKDVVESCREKISKVKIHLELNLVTAVKENKKCFYKYINNKEQAKEKSPPFIGCGCHQR